MHGPIFLLTTSLALTAIAAPITSRTPSSTENGLVEHHTDVSIANIFHDIVKRVPFISASPLETELQTRAELASWDGTDNDVTELEDSGLLNEKRGRLGGDDHSAQLGRVGGNGHKAKRGRVGGEGHSAQLGRVGGNGHKARRGRLGGEGHSAQLGRVGGNGHKAKRGRVGGSGHGNIMDMVQRALEMTFR